MQKNWFIGKDPDAGKDWRQEEKGTTEDKMVGWHHHLNEHEFEQALGVDDGQGSLCAAVHDCRVRHDWVTELKWKDSSKIFNKLPTILEIKNQQSRKRVLACAHTGVGGPSLHPSSQMYFVKFHFYLTLTILVPWILQARWHFFVNELTENFNLTSFLVSLYFSFSTLIPTSIAFFQEGVHKSSLF